MDDDPFDLKRFVAAQDPVWDRVRAELAQGEKRSHWMWFVFPQISPTARAYAISSREEARAYLAHSVLGPRLRESTALVNAVAGRSAERILGGIDAMKFRSSMTLFAEVAPEEPLFRRALEKYFGGEKDRVTLEKL